MVDEGMENMDTNVLEVKTRKIDGIRCFRDFS